MGVGEHEEYEMLEHVNCPKSPTQEHEPDLTGIPINWGGPEYEIDCIHCGALGTIKEVKVEWE